MRSWSVGDTTHDDWECKVSRHQATVLLPRPVTLVKPSCLQVRLDAAPMSPHLCIRDHPPYRDANLGPSAIHPAPAIRE